MATTDLKLQVLLELQDRALQPLKQLAKQNQQLVDGLTKAQQQINKLGAAKGAIENLRRAQESTKDTANKLATAQQRLAALQAKSPAQLDQSAGAQKRHAAAIKSAAQAVEQLTRKRATELDQLKRLRAGLNSLGIGKLSAAEAGLARNIERATRSFRDQEKAIERLAAAREKHTHDIMRGGAMVAFGGSLARAGARTTRATIGPVRGFMEHEDSMLGIARQVPGARNEMGQLTEVYRQAEKEVRELSQSIPLSTTAIADMYTAAARMEVPTEHLKEQVKLAAEMAIAFDAVPDEIAESMGKVAKNFKIPVTEIRGLADAINYLDDNAISKGGDIIDYLNRTSGVLSSVSMSSSDAAALGSALLTMGERAETAGTATNTIIQKLAAAEKGTPKMRRAIKDIGLSAKGIQAGMQSDAMGTLQNVLAAINKLPEAKRVGIMVDLVGLNHSDTLAKLASKPEELQRQLDLVRGGKASGSMAREAQARYATMSAHLQTVENRLFNLKAIAGEALVPAITRALEAVTPLVEKLSQFAKENPKLTATILQAALAIGVLMAALAPFVAITGYLLMAKSMLSVAVALRTATAAATAAKPALGLLYRLGYGLGRAWAVLLPMLRMAGAGLLRLGALAGPVLNALRVAVMALASTVGLAFALMGAAIYLWVTRWEAIKEGLAFIWDDLKAAFNAGITWLQSLPARMMEMGRNVVQGLIGGITGKLAELQGAISGMADNTIGWFKGKLGINSPSRVFLRLGGWVSEGAALGIAQKAPLVARAAGAMAALPVMAATPALATGGQAVGAAMQAAPSAYHITINAAPGQDAQAIARAVAAELDRRERDSAARGRSRLADR